MPRIDPYLRSIEKFGANGAVLTSGQPVTLRFPTGDRQATQLTPHDQLVAMVREVAPPPMLDQIDQQRPARFEVGGYAISVTPRPGSWQVAIEPAAAAAPAAPPRPARQITQVEDVPSELAIERGQYDGPAAAPSRSGSPLLDALTSAARSARASDMWLATGAPPLMRTAGAWHAIGERGALDAETLSRELGIVAPAEARATWQGAVFTYSDGTGRVRVTLSRDQRGPGAALRLLASEPPGLDRLGLVREVGGWLDQRGLVLVAGGAGAGKTTTLAALVRALGDRQRRVAVIEDPIEIVHASPFVSQRAVGEHVANAVVGIEAARREGVDAIAVGEVGDSEVASAIVDAVAAGHLVLAVVAAHDAFGRLVDLVAPDRRDAARRIVEPVLLGTITPSPTEAGRSFDVRPGR